MNEKSIMEHNIPTEAIKGGIAVGGAVISLATLNYIVSVLTIIYLVVVLWNAIPKALETYKYWKHRAGAIVRRKSGGCDGN